MVVIIDSAQGFGDMSEMTRFVNGKYVCIKNLFELFFGCLIFISKKLLGQDDFLIFYLCLYIIFIYINFYL